MRKFLKRHTRFVGVAFLPLYLACASAQTTGYKTVGAAQDAATVALQAYEAEFEAHLTTPAQDASVTALHRSFEAAVIVVAQANIAYNDAKAAVAAGKTPAVDPASALAAITTATNSAIQAGTDLVNFINSVKK